MILHPMNAAPEVLNTPSRIWFTVHVSAYLLFCIAQMLLFPLDTVGLMLRAGLFATLIAHFSWLTASDMGVVRAAWQHVEVLAPSAPLLTDGQRSIQQQHFTQHEFWFRWHDIG
ncbi:MAG: hypothetical protein K8J31_12795 [Anaerolineae bacterium]|nr:hypothetical protein [Anaerolineae bacterium]